MGFGFLDNDNFIFASFYTKWLAVVVFRHPVRGDRFLTAEHDKKCSKARRIFPTVPRAWRFYRTQSRWFARSDSCTASKSQTIVLET